MNCTTKRFYRGLLAGLLLFAVVPAFAQEQKQKLPKYELKEGPFKASMKGIAEINVPKGYVFADGYNTRIIMRMMGNQETDMEVGYLAPKNENWFLVFEFSETGYVKDDEKDSLDADAIFKSLKKGDEEGNEWRRNHGVAEMHLEKWLKKPHYDTKTNNLEWGTLSMSEGSKVINYNIRYLGRSGVMEVILVSGDKNFNPALKASKKLLSQYNYTSGNRYAEYVEGDKIAEYGLTALVTGGAFAAAVKTGLLQKFWKFIVAGIAGIGAFFKRFFGKKGNDSEEI